MATGGLTISGTSIGDGKVTHKLGVIVANGSDFRPAWTDVHKVLIKGTQHEFRTQGGGGWAKLSEPYATRKSKEYPGKPILRATDAMWKSLTDPNDAQHINMATASSLTFGSMDEKAVYHQYGIPSRNLPARPMIFLVPEMRIEILKILQAHIMKNLDYARVTL